MCLRCDTLLLSLQVSVRISQRVALNLEAALKRREKKKNLYLLSQKSKCQQKRGQWYLLPAVLCCFFPPTSSGSWEVARLQGWMSRDGCFVPGACLVPQPKISWKWRLSLGVRVCKTLHFRCCSSLKTVWAFAAKGVWSRDSSCNCAWYLQVVAGTSSVVLRSSWPAWMFLSAWTCLVVACPVLLSFLVCEFPQFPQLSLFPFCIACFPGESEYFGASWTKKELWHTQPVLGFFGLCNKDWQKLKKTPPYLITACCNEDRLDLTSSSVNLPG